MLSSLSFYIADRLKGTAHFRQKKKSKVRIGLKNQVVPGNFLNILFAHAV